MYHRMTSTLAGGTTRPPSAASGPQRPSVTMGSPATISEEVRRSAKQGELQKVFKWLRKGYPKGRLVGALFPTNSAARSGCEDVQHGFGVLHAAAAYDQVETVRELLKRRVSIDRPNGYGYTALMLPIAAKESRAASSSCCG